MFAPKVKTNLAARHALLLVACLALAACGGGGGGGGGSNGAAANTAGSSTASSVQAVQDNAAEGDRAAARLNELRAHSGVPQLARNAAINTAARSHSRYTVFNNDTGHDETAGRQYFTGVTVAERIAAAGYPAGCTFYCAEVFLSGPNVDGRAAVNDLFSAIYHRFAMLSAFATDMGAASVTGVGSASASGTHVTVNLAGGSALTPAYNSLAFYPYNNQPDAPRSFYSDFEVPDPVPPKNEVGYPISIQTPEYCNARLVPSSFQLFRVSGTTLTAVPVYFLGATAAPTDPNLIDLVDPPASQNYPFPPKTTMQQESRTGVAIMAVDPLLPGTTYEVRFTGTAYLFDVTSCNVSPNAPVLQSSNISRTWRFTTVAQ